jgi:hypothetical protein
LKNVRLIKKKDIIVRGSNTQQALLGGRKELEEGPVHHGTSQEAYGEGTLQEGERTPGRRIRKRGVLVMSFSNMGNESLG